MRNGTISARLDFHDINIFPRLIDRTNATTHEKDKGLIMIEKILSRFSIESKGIEFKIDEFRKRMLEMQIVAFTPDSEEVSDMKTRMGIEPIEWTRDKEGKLISPWDLKRKEEKEGSSA